MVTVKNLTHNFLKLAYEKEKKSGFNIDELLDGKGSKKKLRKVRADLPKNPFFKMAEEAPLVIFGGQLYQVAEGPESDNYIEVEGMKYSLIPAMHLDDLEGLYEEVEAEGVFKFKKAYVQGKINEAIKSHKEMTDIISKNKVIGFIVKEVFPFYLGDEDSIDDTIEGKGKGENLKVTIEDILKKGMGKGTRQEEKKVKRKSPRPALEEDEDLEADEENIQDIDDFLSSTAPKAYRKRFEETSESRLSYKTPNKQLGKLLKGNFACFGKTMFKLSQRNVKESEILLSLEGIKYSLEMHVPLQELEAEYMDRISKSLQKQAIRESDEQNKVIADLEEESKALDDILNREEFSLGDVGFIKRNDNYYVYLKIPECAMKHESRNEFYSFKPCRVALKVRMSGKDFQYDGPYVIEAVRNPFVGSHSSWQGVCTGNYDRHKLRNLSTGAKIAHILSDTKSGLMGMAYDKRVDEHHGHHPLGSGYFPTISVAEIKKKNLPVLNISGKKYEEIFGRKRRKK
ncbi:MAG: hypothetical protein ABIB71_06210 [Candidatus Woesearchaeota archaeon]